MAPLDLSRFCLVNLLVAVMLRCAVARDPWTLKGRRAIVTGGSQGIGRGIVEELLAQGCTVLTCARDVAPLQALEVSLHGDGGTNGGMLHVIEADVSTPEGRGALVASADALFDGALDILVNNVGTNVRKASEDFTDEEYAWLMRTNQDSAFHLSRQCLRLLRKAADEAMGADEGAEGEGAEGEGAEGGRGDATAGSGGGGGRGGRAAAAASSCVVNVSSISGVTVDNTGCPYHMAKAGMNHMTRYMACEWGAHGIRVNAVAPWFIATPLTEPILKGDFAGAVYRATPLGRVGTTPEVARVVAFLCMDAASYVTGQVLTIDGAFTCDGFRYSPPH